MTETHHINKTPRTTHSDAPALHANQDDAAARRVRKYAIAAGIFFLLTDVSSIAAVLLYEPLTQNPGFVTTTTGSDFPIRLGAFLEILLTIGIVGAALALYPILKRKSQPLAFAYVIGRALEAAAITVGILSLLAALTLRAQFTPGQDNAATYTAISTALVALHDWTFLYGPWVIVSLHATILGYLLVSTKLVPRWIGLLALLDGPPLFAAAIAMLFGGNSPTSPGAIALALPMLTFEVSLSIWLITKGFNAPALAALEANE